MAKTVLFVVTSHDQLGTTGQKTGTWAEEIAAPYYIFTEAGWKVTIASIKGGKVPVDDASLQGDFFTEAAKRFWDDAEAKKTLEQSVPLSEVANSQPDAVYLPGGHGVMWDLPNNTTLAKLLEETFAAGKIVSAVCHGPIGLASAKKPDGTSIVNEKRVTGFSNSEEDAVGKSQYVPYLLEDKLKELGGRYEKSSDWSVFALADGNLITGQNPQSSARVAQLVLAA
jgi:putative intracellular protease/amidase